MFEWNDYRVVESKYKSLRTEVLRAVRESDGVQVVLKVRKEFVAEESETSLIHEYEIGETLTGEYSVNYLALEQMDQKSMLVLQDDEMNSLESVLPQTGFDIAVFLTLALEIVSAIEEIHAQKIIHRDINPANLIVNSNLDRVMLIDFGLATKISEEMVGFEPPAELRGTLQYISPEQTGRINKPVDSRSDLYSLGILLYKMAVGELPFDFSNPSEMIYAHIAKNPVSVSVIKPKIPSAISLLIEKLLEKSPEERYQTATGVKKDLIFIQKALIAEEKVAEGGQVEEKANISYFRPGYNEYTGTITLSGKLYGREEETAFLLDCFNRCSRSGQTVTVTGAAGIGKTALIRELYVPITKGNGFFLSGKFDQLNRGLAYTAIAEALKEFVQQCLGQNQIALDVWRTAIQSSVGEFGHVITDIIPEFEMLIGKQKSIPLVSPVETVARRNLVFLNLIKDICAAGYPLIIFLDDLQWADSATLSLLEIIIEESPQNLMMILSYRDSEISAIHPVKMFLDRIKKKEVGFANLHLDLLSLEAITRWMDDVLLNAGKTAQELAVQLALKSGGNPFYVTSLLYLIIEKSYIRRKTNGSLLVDMDAVTNIPTDIDVVEHLIRKVEDLGESDSKFLTEVSILGNKFSLDTIELLLGDEKRVYQKAIQVLVGAHLLVKSGEQIFFAHDRVQQAARSMLDDNRARALHLLAGQKISAVLEDQGLADERIEEYVHHYNAAADLITDENQRLKLVELNVELGKWLKSNAAYQAAENAFVQAVVFLPQDPFESNYQLAVDLFTEYGEVLFLNLKYEEGEKQFNNVISHSKSPLVRANIYKKQIDHYASHNEPVMAMQIATGAFEDLGISWPNNFLKIVTKIESWHIRSLLKQKQFSSILDLPKMEDQLALAQIEVLAATFIPAYFSYPDYWPIIALKMMRISMEHGNCDISLFGYMLYAVMLCNSGRVDEGYCLGKNTLKLFESTDVKDVSAKIPHIFGLFVHHWKDPMKDGFKYMDAAVANGFKTGDYEYASYSANMTMHYLFYSGEKITIILEKYKKQHQILEELGKKHAILEAKFWHQMLISLHDESGDGVTVSGDYIDERWLVPLLEEHQDFSALEIYSLGKLQLAYLAGEYELSQELSQKVMGMIKALPGTVFIVAGRFFSALSYIAYYRNIKKKSHLLREVKSLLKPLKTWGKHSPANYLSKALLVEAELFSVTGDQVGALKLYEKAISTAKKNGDNLVLGIARECMGRYLISIGLDSYGLSQIRRSVDVFQNWGALNKSHRLSKEFNIVISRESILAEGTGSYHSSLANIAKLNLDALVGTIKTLTSDFKFDSLMATLLNVVMQSSGATRVVYIYVDQGRLQARAEKRTNDGVSIFDGKDILSDQFELPISLVEKCSSGLNDYVLENIISARKSWRDDQKESQFKSVLIIPLKRHNAVKGIVYLENDLMRDAFREDQVQFLSLLSGQAAIAIENALVFENLNAERNYSSTIIQNSPSLICGIDSNGVTTFINPVIEEITGYSKGELIGKNWWELFYPGKEYKQVDKLFDALTEGDVIDYEMTLTCKNREKVDVVWNSFTKRDNNNNILEIIGFGNDITIRKRAEKELQLLTDELSEANEELIQHKENLEDLVDDRTKELHRSLENLKETQGHLIQSEKMAALGDLVAGVAHEINTPVGVGVTAASYLEGIATKFSDEYKTEKLTRRNFEKFIDDTQDSSKMILSNLKRAVDLIQSFKQVAVDQSSEKQREFNIKKYINEILVSLYPKFKQTKHNIIVNCPEGIIVKSYPGALSQILTNLLMNSLIHGFEEIDKGTITIDVSKKGKTVKIICSDSGKGIAEEEVKKIFDPFYTTKRGSGGSGLGLHIAYNLVTQTLGGTIQCESVIGEGATFQLEFPCELETLNSE